MWKKEPVIAITAVIAIFCISIGTMGGRWMVEHEHSAVDRLIPEMEKAAQRINEDEERKSYRETEIDIDEYKKIALKYWNHSNCFGVLGRALADGRITRGERNDILDSFNRDDKNKQVRDLKMELVKDAIDFNTNKDYASEGQYLRDGNNVWVCTKGGHPGSLGREFTLVDPKLVIEVRKAQAFAQALQYEAQVKAAANASRLKEFSDNIQAVTERLIK